MNRFTLSLCGLALLAGLTGCKHSDPTPPPPAADPLTLLPKETQTGENTFGCLINGKAYLAPPATYAHGDYTLYPYLGINGSMYLNGNYNSDRHSMSFVLSGALNGMKPTPFSAVVFFASGQNQFSIGLGSSTGIQYTGKNIKSGQLVLTKFDGAARIASGRFALTLYEPGSSDTLRVTDGRFDVKF